MPEMHLRQFAALDNSVYHLQKTKTENKNLKKYEIHYIFIKTN